MADEPILEKPKASIPLPHVIKRPAGMPRAQFSGRPRTGQWVLVDGNRVGIHAPPNPGSEMAEKVPPGFFLIHYVNTMGLTVGHEIVEFTRLEPLMDRNLVPAVRLATMDKHWSPRP